MEALWNAAITALAVAFFVVGTVKKSTRPGVGVLVGVGAMTAEAQTVHMRVVFQREPPGRSSSGVPPTRLVDVRGT